MVTKQEHEDAERRIQAELQVDAFFTLIQARYGIKPEAIPEILDDLRWVREHRSNLNRVSWSVVLGIITLALTGMAFALWEGMKAKMR